MDNDFTIGINEPALDDIMLKLNNDIDTISTLLHDIEMKMYDINEYFSGDVSDKVKNKFKSYSDQYDTLKDNLNTYVNDIMNVKAMLGKIDMNNQVFFVENAEEIRHEKDVQEEDNDTTAHEITITEDL